MTSPCLECKQRYPGCHDYCRAYALYHFKNELAKKRRYEYNEINRHNPSLIHANKNYIRRGVTE